MAENVNKWKLHKKWKKSYFRYVLDITGIVSTEYGGYCGLRLGTAPPPCVEILLLPPRGRNFSAILFNFGGNVYGHNSLFGIVIGLISKNKMAATALFCRKMLSSLTHKDQ